MDRTRTPQPRRSPGPARPARWSFTDWALI